jgi:putative ABC transport system substrate-binding protein
MSLIERRRFAIAATVLLALAAAGGPWAVCAQQAARGTHRIGYLTEGGTSEAFVDYPKRKKPRGYHRAFLRGLAEAGFIPGKNLIIEYRFAEDKVERLPHLVNELLTRKVEVIFSRSSGALAAAQATKTVPVVFLGITDPVASKLVKSLAHPGGNVTGISNQGVEINTKRLELLTAAIPSARRVAVLIDHEHSLREQTKRDLAAAAPSLGVQIDFFEVAAPDQIVGAFAAMKAAGADSLLVQESGEFFLHRKEISQLALDNRLPAICHFLLFVRAGCLMSYGADFADIYRRAGDYVARILNGADPADLPVQQPVKFDLIVNARTAKALGVVFPRSMLLRADQIIE